MSKTKRSGSYHHPMYRMIETDTDPKEPVTSIADDESEEEHEGTNNSSLWKALINLMGDLEGTGTLAYLM